MKTRDALLAPLDAMTKTKHISVCICTHKRSHLLKHLLQKLACQDTEDLFTYSIVVVESADVPTASEVVAEFAAASTIRVTYCTQPIRSIALTRAEGHPLNVKGDFHYSPTLSQACGSSLATILGPAWEMRQPATKSTWR